MSKSVSILIPNRFTWEAIELTVESILKNTWYDNHRIIVCDNSMAANNRACEPKREGIGTDDGNRLEYLREQARNGAITLIENKDQDKKYGHGENIKVLLKACNTEYALLFNSTVEIIKSYWINELVDLIKTDKDLGVAKFRTGGKQGELNWISPVYWPNVMLLNMPLYKEFGNVDEDWDLRRIPLSEWKYRDIFKEYPPLKGPESKPEHVFLDTGYRLWERLEYENPGGLRMLPLPIGYYTQFMTLFDGIDRNSHRPNHPHVVKQRTRIQGRLRFLRCQ